MALHPDSQARRDDFDRWHDDSTVAAWYREEAPRGLRGPPEPKRSLKVDLRRFDPTWDEDEEPAGWRHWLDRFAKGPRFDRSKLVALADGGRRRFRVPLLDHEFEPARSEKPTRPADHFVTLRRIDEGASPGRPVLRFEPAPHWVRAGDVIDEIDEATRRRLRIDRAARDRRMGVAPAGPTPRRVPPEPPEDWRARARCEHCGDLGVHAKGLCAACYRFSRRHGGQLPPADVLRSRQWKNDYPLAQEMRA